MDNFIFIFSPTIRLYPKQDRLRKGNVHNTMHVTCKRGYVISIKSMVPRRWTL